MSDGPFTSWRAQRSHPSFRARHDGEGPAVTADCPPFDRVKKAASTSFLKKRSKKLLLICAMAGSTISVQIDKSFLLLFFKKEVLAYFP